MKYVVDFENAELIGDPNTKYRVCVLINTFNHVNYIEKCLNSIIEQNTNFLYKIIVHDDCSTDGTKEILLKFYASNPDKILLILENENQWQKGVSNIAMILTWLDSDYIALCEGDDFWNVTYKLQLQLDFLDRNIGTSLFCHDVEILNERSDVNYALELRNHISNFPAENPELKLGKGNFIMTCSVMFRNKVIQKGFLEGIHSLLPVDWLIFAALADSGKIHYSEERLSTYRIHDTSAWSSQNVSIRQERTAETFWYLAGALKGRVGQEAKKALPSS
ncbi:unannotated protein [freshwater metagenome]|uniref:Unannotated protein n=1 Tax=freshwater metagenome TaxID=449393 RepID=A0A6J7I5M1_9ZZZZ